ncbi:MAG: multiheme c-type cytochrome, partial [Phycisphaerae bacterium]
MALLKGQMAQGQALPGTPPTSEPLPKINPDGLTSSTVCGECHQAIHAVWRQSMHAKAWSNGIFQAGYRRSIESFGVEKARVCLSCHAPTVLHSKDYTIQDPITAEGITCDFCHSVESVALSDPGDPIRLNVGRTKYGPLRHAQSPAHEIVDTKLHMRSEFCGACHEYRNANGVT